MSNNIVSLDNIAIDTNYDGSNGLNVGDFLQSLEAKRKQQQLLVPTNDEDVRRMLAQYKEPQETTAEETKAERRDRLIQYVKQNGIELSQDREMKDASEDEADEEEEFYTPASIELIEARKNIISFTSQRSKIRLEKEYKQSKLPMDQILPFRHAQTKKFQSLELAGSNLISTRPLSSIAVNPHNHNEILSGTWNDGVYLLNQELETRKHFAEPEGKVSSISWNPVYDDKFIVPSHTEFKLFSTHTANTNSIATFTGHEDRVTTVAHHPSSQYIASSSFDRTWRLWDSITAQELILQEAHSKEVFSLSFNSDGQLLVSAGLDAIAYVWDLRGDRSIFTLEGHIRGIHSVKFRKNNYHIVTGASDGAIKVWDLRAQSCLETIHAHKGLISSLGFVGDNDEIMYSAGFDGLIKAYNSDSWVKSAELMGHQGKVMGCDFVQDDSDHKRWKGFSCGWDLDVKIWE